MKTSMMMASLMAAGVLSAGSLMADVKVSGIFSNNMVLQRGKPIPVSGTAEAGEKVSVSFAGQVKETTADAKGAWCVRLDSMAASAEPRILKVAASHAQPSTLNPQLSTLNPQLSTLNSQLTFTNVVVGDVWLVSGQSNAEMPFRWGILNGAAEKAKAKDYPNVRAVKFRRETSLFPITDRPCCGKWTVATAAALDNISAEGYFMAREINAKTGVPIGILDNNWGGCRIEPYVCAEGLKTVPSFKGAYEKLIASREQTVDWCCRVAALKAQGGGDYGKAGPKPETSNWTIQHNAMIEPIVSFPICGATWYHGCANAGDGVTYAPKLQALVAGWRAKWGYDFPFYIVQISSFLPKTTDPQGGNGFAKIREGQRVAQRKIPNTGLVVTIDVGNAKDIHPKNKYDVGYRLSLWALRDVYGMKDLVVSGPLYREMKVEGGKARLLFDHVGSGLFAGEKDPNTPGEKPTATPDGKLRGFAIAGANRKWYWADAVIDGNDVVVSAKEVPAPVAVRYAFRTNPMGDCNLYNREGLPASPFSTNNWE